MALALLTKYNNVFWWLLVKGKSLGSILVNQNWISFYTSTISLNSQIKPVFLHHHNRMLQIGEAEI
jgi:hypothetical protein